TILVSDWSSDVCSSDLLRLHRLDFSNRHFVVAANLHLGTQFAQVLDQVVSERIVVVEDEDHSVIVMGDAAADGEVSEFRIAGPQLPLVLVLMLLGCSF